MNNIDGYIVHGSFIKLSFREEKMLKALLYKVFLLHIAVMINPSPCNLELLVVEARTRSSYPFQDFLPTGDTALGNFIEEEFFNSGITFYINIVCI